MNTEMNRQRIITQRTKQVINKARYVWMMTQWNGDDDGGGRNDDDDDDDDDDDNNDDK
jgi:hypothetical protein